ncbi:MAG: hypothetical protein R3Y16_07075 [Rikenellaceae bacterium]
MRNFLLSLSFFVAAAATISSAEAQTRTYSPSSVRYTSSSTSYENFWSVRAGVSFSNLFNDFRASRYQTGYNGAVLYNISISESSPIYLQTGLGLSMKGARNSRILADAPKSQFKSYEAEIPVTIAFELATGRHSAIIPEIGVYYSYGFCGTLGANGAFYRPYEEQEIVIDDWGTINSRLVSRSDFGMRFGLSYLMGRYLMGFAYEAGLLNCFASDLQDLGYKGSSGSWSINVGYRFN